MGSTPGTLVIQTAFLGDVVLTTGLLNALMDRGEGPVDVVTTPGGACLLQDHPAVDRVIPYDKRGQDRGMAGIRRIVREVGQREYRRVYLPHRSARSAFLAWRTRIPERIGFADAPLAVGYTRQIERPREGHEAERLLALAEPAPGTRARVTLGLTAADRSAADQWLMARSIGAPFIAIAPGSIWGTKRWPFFGDFAAGCPVPVVVVGGPEDGALAEEITARRPLQIYSAAGELGLKHAAAVLERAAALVTNDSAPLHLAGAVGTPTVAIFGPTVPAFGFGPRGSRDLVIEVPDLACRPCSSHGPARCPLSHHDCMRRLSVRVVTEAVDTILRSS